MKDSRTDKPIELILKTFTVVVHVFPFTVDCDSFAFHFQTERHNNYFRSNLKLFAFFCFAIVVTLMPIKSFFIARRSRSKAILKADDENHNNEQRLSNNRKKIIFIDGLSSRSFYYIRSFAIRASRSHLMSTKSSARARFRKF